MIKDLDYYMSLNYRIEVIEDKEEGGYALHCPDLPGCITCTDTIEKGFDMIEDAKKCWISVCLEDGTPIPEPKILNNAIDLDEIIYRKIGKLSPENKQKTMNYISELIVASGG